MCDMITQKLSKLTSKENATATKKIAALLKKFSTEIATLEVFKNNPKKLAKISKKIAEASLKNHLGNPVLSFTKQPNVSTESDILSLKTACKEAISRAYDTIADNSIVKNNESLVLAHIDKLKESIITNYGIILSKIRKKIEKNSTTDTIEIHKTGIEIELIEQNLKDTLTELTNIQTKISPNYTNKEIDKQLQSIGNEIMSANAANFLEPYKLTQSLDSGKNYILTTEGLSTLMDIFAKKYGDTNQPIAAYNTDLIPIVQAIASSPAGSSIVVMYNFDPIHTTTIQLIKNDNDSIDVIHLDGVANNFMNYTMKLDFVIADALKNTSIKKIRCYDHNPGDLKVQTSGDKCSVFSDKIARKLTKNDLGDIRSTGKAVNSPTVNDQYVALSENTGITMEPYLFPTPPHFMAMSETRKTLSENINKIGNEEASKKTFNPRTESTFLTQFDKYHTDDQNKKYTSIFHKKHLKQVIAWVKTLIKDNLTTPAAIEKTIAETSDKYNAKNITPKRIQEMQNNSTQQSKVSRR